MSVWKFTLCFAVLAITLSHGIPVKDVLVHNKENVDSQLTVTKERIEFPKDDLRKLVDLFSRRQNKEEVVVNEDVEELLNKLNTHIIMSGLDPTQLLDEGFEFSWKILLLTIHGEMTLKGGWLQGLGSLYRKGDCILTSDGTTMTLTLPLTFSDLLFNYQYRAKFMGLGPSGGVDGSMRNSKFTIVINVDVATLMVESQSFKLHNVGDISLKFSGNGILDWIANMLTSVTLTFLKPILKVFIFDDWVYNGINEIIALYNESVCQITGIC